jgi:hypothetical protein
MSVQIEPGMMVFVTEGREGIGAVRTVDQQTLKIHIENAGEFHVPLSAVTSVHDEKVMIDISAVSDEVRAALAHTHDAEDPNLVG